MSSDRLTEILNYVSAISRDIGIFRAEVNAFRAEVNTRLDQLEARVQSLEARMQGVEGEVRGLRADVRTLTNQLNRFGARVLDIRADIDELQDRVTAVEEKLNAS
jgi:chromosome segregation ATPase